MIVKNLRTSSPFRSFLSGSGVLSLAAVLIALPVVSACGDGSSGPGGAGAAGGSGGAGGTGGTGGAGGAGGAGGGPPADPCDWPHDTEVNVADAAALTDALSKAAPGQLIRLAAGTYADTFDLEMVSGTADKPIIVCGPRDAILDTSAMPANTGLRLLQVNYWVVSGITITGGRKGIYVDGSSDNILSNLFVHDVGEMAIQLRNGASRNTIEYSEITNTGLAVPDSAEGIYVGSDDSAWPSPDMPDACDGTKILSNKFGPGIKTEHVDLKEGTQGGEVRGNTFNGEGLTADGSEDAWVAVTGNKYLFAENTGDKTPKDGFVVRQATMGWGNDNVFEKNTANGITNPNLGINVGPGTTGTIVKCDNKVTGTGMLSNVECTN
ncbi:right-handed parallel beta-helix repeat-containing protein [Polyangium jinanense]|uniref:Right-handed parallel beta-helix repeat-containing protein n=1 Tax=Polyangium jinanense TaxID=2829994 RepID=A0A9X4AQ44_9BACT|nr:right-handed parallel beta-helix repeat-containing protein [Polyangium jinanense]MDC3954405.1 right-handed parallel beta-helix repeat-containing protein [Polyangium jinanense]MDC3980708.1 right-handed parallel beta-helix repeat-containing protein [Polyangium jinanense]